jgi:sec-independent protein translocase protein TatA
MFGNIGFPELVIVLAIVLLLFGAGRLPEVARSMGKAIREFKSAVSGATEDDSGKGKK